MSRRPLALGARVVRVLQYCLIAAAVFVIPQLFLPLGLDVNHSESLPRGLYWHENAPQHLSRGDWACFGYIAPAWAVDRHYFPDDAQLCKVVMGLAGDRIVARDDHVFVCPDNSPCLDGGAILKADSQGRAATAAALPSRIPPGFFYMGSTRVSNSFDSRYVGLIDHGRITRRIHPLLVER